MLYNILAVWTFLLFLVMGFAYRCGKKDVLCSCDYIDSGTGILADCSGLRRLDHVPWAHFTTTELDMLRVINMTGSYFCDKHSTSVYTNGIVVLCKNKHAHVHNRYHEAVVHSKNSETDSDKDEHVRANKMDYTDDQSDHADMENDTGDGDGIDNKINTIIGIVVSGFTVIIGLGVGCTCYVYKAVRQESNDEEGGDDGNGEEEEHRSWFTRVTDFLCSRCRNDKDEDDDPEVTLNPKKGNGRSIEERENV